MNTIELRINALADGNSDLDDLLGRCEDTGNASSAADLLADSLLNDAGVCPDEDGMTADHLLGLIVKERLATLDWAALGVTFAVTPAASA